MKRFPLLNFTLARKTTSLISENHAHNGAFNW